MKYRILIFEIANENLIFGIGQVEVTKEKDQAITDNDLRSIGTEVMNKINQRESEVMEKNAAS